MARKTATFSRPADNTAYASGDHIANSGTGALVTPMEFLLDVSSGLLLSLDCTVTPTSGNLVITNLDFDVLIFRPVTNVPFAAGSFPADNAAMAITAASFYDLVTVFSFTNDNWRNPAGALTAGVTGRQTAVPTDESMAEFDTLGLNKLIAVVQAKAAWTPTGVANRFDFVLKHSFE